MRETQPHDVEWLQMIFVVGLDSPVAKPAELELVAVSTFAPDKLPLPKRRTHAISRRLLDATAFLNVQEVGTKP